MVLNVPFECKWQNAIDVSTITNPEIFWLKAPISQKGLIHESYLWSKNVLNEN